MFAPAHTKGSATISKLVFDCSLSDSSQQDMEVAQDDQETENHNDPGIPQTKLNQIPKRTSLLRELKVPIYSLPSIRYTPISHWNGKSTIGRRAVSTVHNDNGFDSSRSSRWTRTQASYPFILTIIKKKGYIYCYWMYDISWTTCRGSISNTSSFCPLVILLMLSMKG